MNKKIKKRWVWRRKFKYCRAKLEQDNGHHLLLCLRQHRHKGKHRGLHGFEWE